MMSAIKAICRISCLLLTIVFLTTQANQVRAQNNGQVTKTAILQGLDKVTARITKLKVGVGRGVRFGSLLITVRTCDKRPPEEPPEVTAFIEIIDDKPGEAPEKLFSGFMFASSPALSAMEHPVYDVWVIDCNIDDPSTSAGAE
jgi:hypothetical protein